MVVSNLNFYGFKDNFVARQIFTKSNKKCKILKHLKIDEKSISEAQIEARSLKSLGWRPIVSKGVTRRAYFV